MKLVSNACETTTAFLCLVDACNNRYSFARLSYVHKHHRHVNAIPTYTSIKNIFKKCEGCMDGSAKTT